MTQVKIKVKEDYRCFKKDDEYVFDLLDNEPNIIVGSNGAGKSTLLRVLRHTKDTLHKNWLNRHDGVTPTQFDSVDASKFEVDGFDAFDEVFYLDMQIDDPSSFACCTTASSFISMGGYTSSRISRGQGTMIMLSKVVATIEEYYAKNQKGKALVVLDEIDEGFDLGILADFVTKIKNVFHKYNPDTTIIICTHNPMVYINYEVHVVGYNKVTMIPGDLYFEIHTGWSMTLEKCNKIQQDT